MNKAILIGNLTGDPVSRHTSSGALAVTFTVAINRRFLNASGNREADFINIVAWHKTAEICAQYLHKGSKVCVVGRIQSRSYDAQDGSKRYVTEVIADEIELLGKRDGNVADTLPPEPPAPAAAKADESAHVPRSGFVEVDDDELPF